MSPKRVNYEYNRATISNRQCCRLNQSLMNIIEPQFPTIITVAQTVNYEYIPATISKCRPKQSVMNVIEPQFQTIYRCRLNQSIMNIVQPHF